jgi:glycerol-3-phosphate acyltransferase PlsY
MENILILGIIILGYLIGSIPFGYLIVSVFTGKDLRNIQSGRTGGTNAMRAAGIWAGLFTAIFDTLKGASGVWIARELFPDRPWTHIFVGLVTILGHNYSIFLIERKENGRFHLRGGAGGATTAGAAFALWPPIILIIIPVSILLLFGLGYASVTTMSLPILATLVFAIRADLGLSPWIYALFGLFAEIFLIWALRPNIKRLLNGTERLVGWRARPRSESILTIPDR